MALALRRKNLRLVIIAACELYCELYGAEDSALLDSGVRRNDVRV